MIPAEVGLMLRVRLLLVLSSVFLILLSASAPAVAQQPSQAAKKTPAEATPPATDSAAPVESAAPPETAAPPPGPAAKVPKLKIGTGDLLQVQVYGVPELSQEVRVGYAGDIYLPLIGYVQIADLSPDEAQSVIEKRLRDGGFLNSPHVSVFIKEYSSQGASLMGEVARPGVYPIMGSRRLYDLIASAGGLTPRAGKLITISHRDQPEAVEKVIIPGDPVEAAKSNAVVLPGDTVVVTKAGLVYVVGEVGRPAGLVMENNENMTVLQALALAGGTTPMAASDKSKLIRKTDKGRQEFPLPLKKILMAKSPDVNLQPEDIIFVPGSIGKRAARRSIESIIAIATSLAIYRP